MTMNDLFAPCRRTSVRVLATVLLVFAAGALAAEPTPRLRRVILISCDTLRAASLPRYGNPVTETAGIDSLANLGTVFMRCVTPMGWTLPAHVAMLTSLGPGVSRVAVERGIPEGLPTLTELLAGEGFVCGAFPAVNQWLKPEYGFERGFRQYRFQEVLAPIKNWTRRWDFSEELTPAAPFFLFFHFMDNHTVKIDFDHLLPYWSPRPVDRWRHGVQDPPPDIMTTDDGRWDLAAYEPDLLRRAYHTTVFSLDFLHLRPLFRHLRESGLADDTMIILTADHGEEIAEHGGYLHDSPYNEVREVPLIIVWPGVVPAGETVFDSVSLLDIMPTVADYAGLSVAAPMQGLSLRPLLSRPRGEFPTRDFLIDGHQRGLSLQPSALVGLEGDTWWSLVAMTDTTGCAGTFAPARVAEVLGLYDLDVDPGATVNVREQNPEVVATLTARLNAKLAEEAGLAAEIQGAFEQDVVPMSEADRKKLRALGY